MTPVDLQRIRTQVEIAGLDALIACTPANVQYATGYDTTPYRFLPGPSIAAVWLQDQERMVLVLPAIRLPSALEANLGIELIPYGSSPFLMDTSTEPLLAEQLASPAATLLAGVQQALQGLGTGRRRIGLDEGNLTVSAWQSWTTTMAQGDWTPAAQSWQSARSIKTVQEVEQMTRALHELEGAIENALPAIETGGSEVEINRLIRSQMALRGGFYGAGALCIGARGGAVLPPSHEVTARPGDVVKWDVAGLFGGYWADTARTAYRGEMAAQHQRHLAAVEAAHYALLAAARPGVTAADLYRVGQEAMAKAGLLAPQAHVGHGIGLDLYEPPLLSPSDGTVLEEGMVLCLENPVFDIAAGAFTLEDTVVITSNGCRVLNHITRQRRSL